MALTGAEAPAEEKAKDDQTEKSDLVKRYLFCSRGWTRISGACFKYVNTHMTWARAEKICQSMGAHLTSVENLNEYHELQKMTAPYGNKETWIGGTDAQEENIWFWSNGEKFDYKNWCRGEPNNQKGLQHCLLINHTARKCWDDLQCKARRPFICAKRGWGLINCQSMDAHLASVQDIKEYVEIQNLTAPYGYMETWIGGSNAQEVIIIYNMFTTEILSLAALLCLTMSSTRAADEILRREGKNQHCVTSAMKILTVCVLGWAMLALTRAGILSDEKANDDQTEETEEDQMENLDLDKRYLFCHRGWTRINGACFKYISTPMTWAKAEKNCQSMGAHLASVQDKNEYPKIQKLTAPYGNRETWIGGSDAQEESFWYWTDGEKFAYTNWCSGQPSNYRGKQNCLSMNYSAKKCWDDQECYLSHPSICEKRGWGLLG
ncbi:hypothetical protein Q5P01_002867 [Channa striata]|uniref:C-type lectin domain-containing protein n=1 Tax=Channa striata TaxID=64152 RepID=A0AA88NV26_CHASR|nr:hypothetical protein Q5P01_002867 [Channa striata]